MIVGIVPNIKKKDIFDIVSRLIVQLEKNGIEYLINSKIADNPGKFSVKLSPQNFVSFSNLSRKCDLIVSIGGDGTMLKTAYETRHRPVPLAGVNFGKLGFLAEYDINKINQFVRDIKKGNYEIEERTTLQARCIKSCDKKLFAVNDIVIDKGRWPKMIELTIKVDENYVSTFSADGLIISTPTGSTGYSLSTGGPIISPQAKVIVLSPISPHTLTIRPLVLSDSQKIIITAHSPHDSIQINSDGQHVYRFKPPVSLEISKSPIPMKLVRTNNVDYFTTLRNKLFWGLDLRTNSNNKEKQL